jgi:hypothetical protein
MGFTPSDGFKDTYGSKFHLETSGSDEIVIWNADESKVILRMNYEEARKLWDDLDLLCRMYEPTD